jgi:predicted RNA-binding Zn ribbon-like protein
MTERSAVTALVTERGTLRLLGGHPALDFVNTVDWRGRAAPEEYLTSYGVLLRWAAHTGLVTPAEQASLSRRADAAPPRAAALLDDARALREALYRLLVAQARGAVPRPRDLAALNAVLRRLPPPGEVARSGASYSWKSAAPDDALARPIGRLARIGAEFLVSPELHRLRLCESPECGWLFLDASPNHRRRWCSMEGCGNRAKARRHYRRVRGGAASGPDSAVSRPSDARG